MTITVKILRRYVAITVLMILMAIVSACGAKGDLFLPEDVVKKQQAQKEKEKEKNKKSSQQVQPATQQPEQPPTEPLETQ